MKAKLMNVLDINEPEKKLFGVKIIGIGRPLFVGISGEPGYYATEDKREALKLAETCDKWIGFQGQRLIDKLKENKDIVIVKIDVNEPAPSNSN